MKADHTRNRFVEFFGNAQYVVLKNYLYNYRLRRRAIQQCLRDHDPELILEIGSGISPMSTVPYRSVFSDLSFDAIKILKRNQKDGYHVVADGIRLPFKSDCFSTIICSEVLEHIDDDRRVLQEIARTIKKPDGTVILTVPHRRAYFANDDRSVGHRRRYEIDDIRQRLAACGLRPVLIRKVLGPLEKITMMMVILFLILFQKRKPGATNAETAVNENRMRRVTRIFRWTNHLFFGLAWLDAVIMPRALAAGILVKSVPASNSQLPVHR